MAIDFPVSPTVGQQYIYQVATYVFSAQGVWVQVAGSGSSGIALGVTQQRFTSSGLYTPSPGLLFAIAELVGGGGGGGAVGASGLSIISAAGGGSAGTYTISRLTAAQIGTSQVVTIGSAGVGGVGGFNPGTSGGATSLGALCTAPGGIGATAGAAGAPGIIAITGAASPAVGIGDLSIPGGAGGMGMMASSGTGAGSTGGGGFGGDSHFGEGGKQTVTLNGLGNPGASGTGFGSGGAGGTVFNTAAATAAGGDGRPGYMVITEYIGVSSSGGGGGSISTSFSPPQGRLTLQTLTPVMTTTQAAKTAIFYTPYEGNQVPLYNGTAFVMTVFTELTVLTTDTASSPAAIGVSKVNDWFVWDSGGGVLKLVHGPDWTNDTTRSAGTAIERVQGLWVNSVAITNGPAIRRGTYVGTTRSNAASQLDWTVGGLAANGASALLNVWNAYNRVNVQAFVGESSASWAYAIGTWAPANANQNTTGGNRISWVVGLPEEAIFATHTQFPLTSASNAVAGIGYDSNTAIDAQCCAGICGTAFNGVIATCSRVSDLGAHFFQAMHRLQETGGTCTWGGTLTAGMLQTGMTFVSRM